MCILVYSCGQMSIQMFTFTSCTVIHCSEYLYALLCWLIYKSLFCNLNLSIISRFFTISTDISLWCMPMLFGKFVFFCLLLNALPVMGAFFIACFFSSYHKSLSIINHSISLSFFRNILVITKNRLKNGDWKFGISSLDFNYHIRLL